MKDWTMIQETIQKTIQIVQDDTTLIEKFSIGVLIGLATAAIIYLIKNRKDIAYRLKYGKEQLKAQQNYAEAISKDLDVKKRDFFNDTELEVFSDQILDIVDQCYGQKNETIINSIEAALGKTIRPSQIHSIKLKARQRVLQRKLKKQGGSF